MSPDRGDTLSQSTVAQSTDLDKGTFTYGDGEYEGHFKIIKQGWGRYKWKNGQEYDG